MKASFVIVFLYALIGVLIGAGILGIAFAFGASITMARAVVLLCSAAGLGGLFVTARMLFSEHVSWGDTRRGIGAFVLLLAILGGACAAVLH